MASPNSRMLHLSIISFRTGARCWLITPTSPVVHRRSRRIWNQFPPWTTTITRVIHAPCGMGKAQHPIPQLLVGSGFTGIGPKVLINSIGAHAVGAVTGVHADRPLSWRRVRQHLITVKFNELIVPHAKTLQKVEDFRQLNTALTAYTKKAQRDAKRCS